MKQAYRTIASVLLCLYQRLISAFPPTFRDEFEAEMQAIFRVMLSDAQRQGYSAMARLAGRELAGTLPALLRAHWSELLRSAKREGRSPLEVLLIPQIHPRHLAVDGRQSRLQAILEVTPFLIASVVLLALTYTGLGAEQSGLQRYLQPLHLATLFLALPCTLLGLTRGFPRWAYPWLGFMLGHSVLVAYHQNMLWFAGAVLIALLLLALAAARTHLRSHPLPGILQWIGRSMQLDWTRASFAVHGAAPMLILITFDDGYANNRSAGLALSLLLIFSGAAIYSRSKRQTIQLGILLGTASLALFCSLLNQAHFRGGLQLGATAGSWLQNIGWHLQLWGMVLFLLLAPPFAGPVLARLSALWAADRQEG